MWIVDSFLNCSLFVRIGTDSNANSNVLGLGGEEEFRGQYTVRPPTYHASTVAEPPREHHANPYAGPPFLPNDFTGVPYVPLSGTKIIHPYDPPPLPRSHLPPLLPEEPMVSSRPPPRLMPQPPPQPPPIVVAPPPPAAQPQPIMVAPPPPAPQPPPQPVVTDEEQLDLDVANVVG